MYLPRTIYELLPYGYLTGGAALGAASWRAPDAAWSGIALALAAGGVVAGLVLLLRRRTYRVDASRYDARSLDDA